MLPVIVSDSLLWGRSSHLLPPAGSDAICLFTARAQLPITLHPSIICSRFFHYHGRLRRCIPRPDIGGANTVIYVRAGRLLCIAECHTCRRVNWAHTLTRIFTGGPTAVPRLPSPSQWVLEGNESGMKRRRCSRPCPPDPRLEEASLLNASHWRSWSIIPANANAGFRHRTRNGPEGRSRQRVPSRHTRCMSITFARQKNVQRICQI